MPATAATIQRIHTANMDKQENSFSRKLKENREAYKLQQQQNQFLMNTNKGGFHRSNSTAVSALAKLQEFATPGCSDVLDYQIGKQIGHGAYAVVKEGTHRPTGEKVAMKIYDRFKLMDV